MEEPYLPPGFISEEQYFRKALRFLVRYEWLYNFPATDLLTSGVLGQIPADWWQPLSRLSLDELRQLPKGECKEDWPESLKEMLRVSASLRLPVYDSPPPKAAVIPDKDLRNALHRGMSPKKSHEVIHLAAVINEHCHRAGVRCVVDMGSGIGYLCEVLHFVYGFHVLGLEVDADRVRRAQLRHENTSRYLRGERFGGVRYVECDVTRSSPQFVANLLNEYMLDGRPEPFCLVGLHSCGDLTPTAVNLFHNIRQISTFVLVTCCYHKMEVDTNREYCAAAEAVAPGGGLARKFADDAKLNSDEREDGRKNKVRLLMQWQLRWGRTQGEDGAQDTRSQDDLSLSHLEKVAIQMRCNRGPLSKGLLELAGRSAHLEEAEWRQVFRPQTPQTTGTPRPPQQLEEEEEGAEDGPPVSFAGGGEDKPLDAPPEFSPAGERSQQQPPTSGKAAELIVQSPGKREPQLREGGEQEPPSQSEGDRKSSPDQHESELNPDRDELVSLLVKWLGREGPLFAPRPPTAPEHFKLFPLSVQLKQLARCTSEEVRRLESLSVTDGAPAWASRSRSRSTPQQQRRRRRRSGSLCSRAKERSRARTAGRTSTASSRTQRGRARSLDRTMDTEEAKPEHDVPLQFQRGSGMCLWACQVFRRPMLRLASNESAEYWRIKPEVDFKLQSANLLTRTLYEMYAREYKLEMDPSVRARVYKNITVRDVPNVFLDTFVDKLASRVSAEAASRHKKALYFLYASLEPLRPLLLSLVGLQVAMQHVCEGLILLDRQAALSMWEVASARIVKVGEAHITPRCYALVASKKSSVHNLPHTQLAYLWRKYNIVS